MYPLRVRTQEDLPLVCGIEVTGPLRGGDEYKVIGSRALSSSEGTGGGFEERVSSQENWLL